MFALASFGTIFCRIVVIICVQLIYYRVVLKVIITVNWETIQIETNIAHSLMSPNNFLLKNQNQISNNSQETVVSTTSERRTPPENNCFVDHVYLFIFSEKDDSNSVSHKSYKLGAFYSVEPVSEPVFEKLDYNCSLRGTSALPVSKWYFSMTRVLYLGAIHGETLVQMANESIYFEKNEQIKNNLGFHVYLNKSGVFRLMMCSAHRNNPQILFRTDGSINDVLPKFKRMLIGTNNDKQALIIGTKVQTSDISTGDRDGGRCASGVSYGGVFDLYEHCVTPNTDYRTLSAIRKSHFGLYMCDNAKLVFLDLCRKCNREDRREVHHNRTLYQSGGFLIMEGTLCFQFARYFNEYYTAQDLEQLKIISEHSIVSKINPIYFLGKTNSESSAWGLLSAESVREEQWSLIIPDNAVFEGIESYNVGIENVKYRQSARVAPWSSSVQSDSYVRTMKQKANTNYNTIAVVIHWKTLASTEYVSHKHFNKNPEQFLKTISTTTIDVILSQGAHFRIPVKYELNGELGTYLTGYRYKLRDNSDIWSHLIYFRINGFWYKRESNYNCLPLKLVSCSYRSLPNLFKYGHKEVLTGNEYFDFYRYAQTDQTDTQNAFLVASLQWRSHSEYCTNA